MYEQWIKQEDRGRIIDFLGSISIFGKYNRTLLSELVDSMSLVMVTGGDIFIVQGEVDPVLYIVYKGRLRVYYNPDQNLEIEENRVAELSTGAIVGENSLFLDRPRSANVQAVRDSILLKLTKESLEALERRDPRAAYCLSKIALEKNLSLARPKKPGEDFKTVAIIPAGDTDHRMFAARLFEELSKITSAILIDQQLCNKQFDLNVAQSKVSEPGHAVLGQWLQEMEDAYGYVIYVADRQMTPWTQRCLRRSDRVMLIADTTTYPVLNGIEMELFSDFFRIVPEIELVFIEPDNQKINTRSEEWLKPRKIGAYYHIRYGVKNDIDRFIRLLQGKSFGLCLNGGGVRGFAHIGVLKALEELGVQVDFIGGCSMGGIVGGIYALLLNTHDVMALLDEMVKGFGKDYTLPIVSILDGGICTKQLHTIFGEANIEDLWLRYFCVSTNLTKGKLNIHKMGKLWKAVRASASIPAIYPPVYTDDGDMLIDGGIIDNMPVEIMRDMQGGGKIMAVNCHLYRAGKGVSGVNHYSLSGWRILRDKLWPFSKNRDSHITIGKILMDALNLAAENRQELMGASADFYLELESEKYPLLSAYPAKKVIEEGYRVAMEQLPSKLFPSSS